MTEKQIKRAIELAYLKGLNHGHEAKTHEAVKAHRLTSQVTAHELYMKYFLKVNTKDLLKTIISWEKDLSEYMSLETKLNKLFIIFKR